MFFNNSQSNFNFIQPLPRFHTIRFGRRIETDDDDNNHGEQKIHQAHRPSELSSKNIDYNSSILITGIRNRDWNFPDDLRDFNEKNFPNIKYQLIPSISNTIKNRTTNCVMSNTRSQYEEYDLDEQDFQWLIAYNQFRIEKHLSELDENIFEYIIQLLEQQCLFAIRQKNYEDSIKCDACHRIDDVDDLIQCVQCKMIVHKKCYGGLDENENEWVCLSCRNDADQHRCCICDKSDGALKLLKSEIESQWIHLSCAFWYPKIAFDETMTPILNETLINDDLCCLCSKTIGVKINCCWKNCQNRFHAKCAIDAGQDMLVAENEDQNTVRLLALCLRHSEKLDASEKRTRMKKFQEDQQKRFEQFASYINLDTIQQQTSILPDILESIHTYWILKRQTNNCRPLLDIPDDIFFHDYDKTINLVEFARQYHLDHRNTDFIEDKSNMLQFLAMNIPPSSPSIDNLFIKFVHRHRTYFTDYERSRFCLLDADKKKREGFLQHFTSMKGCL